MTRAERIRRFPKTGWRNLLARHLAALPKLPAPSEFIGYQTQTALHLPFAGEWYVYWGGRSVVKNKHAVARDQRFAYDFLILAQGRRGSRTGTRAKITPTTIVLASRFMLPAMASWYKRRTNCRITRRER